MPKVRHVWALAAAALVTAAAGGPAAAQPVERPPAVPLVPGPAAPPELGALPPPQGPAPPEVAPAPVAGPGLAGDAACPPVPPGCGAAPVARPPGSCARVGYRLQDCFLGYPEEFRAPPLGYSLYQNFRTEVANAETASMVLYQFDFVDGSAVLNPHGRDRLARIAALLPTNFAPVVVERLACAPGLAEARRLAVLNELAKGPFPVPPERVVVGPPAAAGISGVDAALIYENLLIQTQRQGVTAGLGGGSIGGTVGQGFSAPGRAPAAPAPGPGATAP